MLRTSSSSLDILLIKNLSRQMLIRGTNVVGETESLLYTGQVVEMASQIQSFFGHQLLDRLRK